MAPIDQFVSRTDAAGRAHTPPALSGPANVPWRYWCVAFILLLMPLVANSFVLFQIFGWAFILGMVALSLMFLGGYGGMVSLSQMAVAGLAAYMVAVFGTSGVPQVSLGWPWWLAVPVALVIAVAFGTIVGALAVRTEGIYTIMITLAIATAFFYFVRQNYAVFNGFNGFNQVLPPQLFGVDWRQPIAIYYLTLGFATLAYFLVVYVSRAPFGLALQGVRDNPRRMAALGYNVVAHRIAAYAFASFIAAVAGILLVWLNAQVSPGTVAIGPAIDILVIAVIGGMRHPIGPFIGALIFVTIRTFALDILVSLGIPGERFQLLVGLTFLAIVFWSPDGILGLWPRVRRWLTSASSLTADREGKL
jgi:branched-chain amino acid transport system permease protein